MKKIKFNLLIIAFSLSSLCYSQEELFQSLGKELKRGSVNIKYEQIKSKKIYLYKPVFTDSLTQKVIENIINTESKSKDCEEKLKDCEIHIELEIGNNTDNFISLKSITYSMNRPIDFQYISTYNFLIYKNKLYRITFNKTKEDVKASIKKRFLSKEDKLGWSCNYDDNDDVLNLFFKNGKPYIVVDVNKVCNMLLPIKFEASNFSFKEVDDLDKINW